MFHQAFAGNCLELPSEQCFADGLGPDRFDCSGFIVRVIHDVMGVDIAQQDGMRHIRDMWQAAHAGRSVFGRGTCSPGAIIVTERVYDIGRVPAHAGFITTVPEGEMPHFIHAQAGVGRVEERPLRTLNTALGYLAVAFPG